MNYVYIFNNNKIKISIRKDRAILLICIGIAFVFWFFVKLSKTYETVRAVNVMYMLPPNEAFIEMPPEVINVTLEAIGWDLMYDFLSLGEHHITFNLIDYPSPTIDRTELISRLQEQVPSGIKVLNVNRNYIPLDYEEKAVVKVPIILESNLSFAPDYALRDSIILEPDSITVSGPISVIQGLRSWKTQLLSLKDLKNDQTETVSLVEIGNGQIMLTPNEIQVHILIEQFTEKSILVPVSIKNMLPDTTRQIRIFPENITMTCVVGLSRFNDVRPEDFVLEVDLTNISINSENNTLPLTLTKKPSVVQGLNYYPKSVEYFITQ